MDILNKNSYIDNTATIYQGARILESKLNDKTIVGNYSRIDFSTLDSHSRVDRNNHLFHATLGRYSYTGMNTVIMHAKIAAFSSISWNVSIGGANHDYHRMTQHSFLYNSYDDLRSKDILPPYDRFANSIYIANDVWIAAGAVITRGVTIGDGAVIGANAVVTEDIPPYSIVMGAPAKVIKYRFNRDIIEAMLDLKWWNWPVDKIKDNFHLLSEKPNLKKLINLRNNDQL